MKSFVQSHGFSLALVVLVLFIISVAQIGITYTMVFGALRSFLPGDYSLFVKISAPLRFVLVAVLVVLWILKREHALSRLIVIFNALLTLILLTQTINLMTVLLGVTSEGVRALMFDVVLMATSNILIFSIWYWIIDPPGILEPRAGDPWDLLFPQRAGPLPHYESWTPRYLDYLFVAFTTSFAFSPTDTLPLTRRAKMLMLLQAAISVITLTGIAGSTINILAGRN
jgi:hypothetical protein